jgi:hypothetical protein
MNPSASFRRADPYCVIRSYLRYRDELVAARSVPAQPRQKALQQMNVQLTQVLSDVNGVSGLAMIEAILQGQRDPLRLAALGDRRVQASLPKIARALVGDYRAEHLFVLKTACELYHAYEAKIADCDQELARQLAQLPDRVDVSTRSLPAKVGQTHISQEMRLGLYRKLGVDLTAVEGFGPLVGLTVLSEVGPDLTQFKTEKHFASWLGLCPDNRISGGRVLSGRTRRGVNRLSDILRLAATTLERSQTGLGAYYRRMKAKLGAAEGVTATAHKLARLLYRLLKHGEAYVRQGLADYEKKHADRKLEALKKDAASIGFDLVQRQAVTP